MRQVAPGLRTGLSGVHLPVPLLADFLPELDAVSHVGLSFYICPLLLRQDFLRPKGLACWVSSNPKEAVPALPFCGDSMHDAFPVHLGLSLLEAVLWLPLAG